MLGDYDKCQLELMLNMIGLYGEKKLELLSLINNLGSLLDVLEGMEPSWKEVFRGLVWDLEQVYAAFLDRDKVVLEEKDMQVIGDALIKMESLIRNKI